MRVAILGAAGRDFHDFLVRYRDDPGVEVVAFTAAQIPYIADRRFPAALAGPRYPDGIPIVLEEELEALIGREQLDAVVLAYSDLSNAAVAALAARANAAGADFLIPGARGMLRSRRPVVAVCAVRTGCGKSQTVRWMLDRLQARGVRAVGVRHPMPYGDLVAQRVQRFATREDLERHHCTVEEREEYEPYLERGRVVYAGVDYRAILAAAEDEAELILWDGGNNDLPFFRPDLHVVLADPLRVGHSRDWYPSATQVRLADVLVLAKTDTASPAAVEAEEAILRAMNPHAPIVHTASRVTLEGLDEGALAGRRVVCVEDGPTTTHGGVPFGAAWILARRAGATIVDPRPHFVGTLAETLVRYPSLGPIVPAMGYSPRQQADLGATLRAVPADLVLSGTPIDLARLVDAGKPVHRVRYDLAELPGPTSLGEIVDARLRGWGLGAAKG